MSQRKTEQKKRTQSKAFFVAIKTKIQWSQTIAREQQRNCYLHSGVVHGDLWGQLSEVIWDDLESQTSTSDLRVAARAAEGREALISAVEVTGWGHDEDRGQGQAEHRPS